MLWDVLLSPNRIRRISGFPQSYQRIIQSVCALICALWVAAEPMRAYLSASRSKSGPCVCIHTCGAGLGLPSSALVGAETSQDRRAIKASSLSVRPAGEKQRKRPILLLCKPLFHFHTSRSLTLLWYYTGFLAYVQLWTQYSLWDHSSRLLPWASALQLIATTSS